MILPSGDIWSLVAGTEPGFGKVRFISECGERTAPVEFCGKALVGGLKEEVSRNLVIFCKLYYSDVQENFATTSHR